MEEHGDTTPIHIKRSKHSKKTALAFLSAFMATTVIFMLVYIYLISNYFESIFDLQNMYLVFGAFFLTCLLYIACAWVGVTVIIQAKSKRQLDYLQIVMFGIMFFNVLFPTLTLSGTCAGLCRHSSDHSSSTFYECFANPDMMPCPHLCKIRLSIIMMTGLAMFSGVLQIAMRSLWDGIVENDPYSNLSEDEKVKLDGRHGYDGIVPMFVTILSKYEELTLGDTDAVQVTNDIVAVLPENAARVNEELVAERGAIPEIVIEPFEPDGHHHGPIGPNKHGSNKSQSHSHHRRQAFIEVEVKPEPLPTFTMKEYKNDESGKKALNLLRGTVSSKDINVDKSEPTQKHAKFTRSLVKTSESETGANHTNAKPSNKATPRSLNSSPQPSKPDRSIKTNKKGKL